MFGEAPGWPDAGTLYASDFIFRADSHLPETPVEGRNTRNAQPQEWTCHF